MGDQGPGGYPQMAQNPQIGTRQGLTGDHAVAWSQTARDSMGRAAGVSGPAAPRFGVCVGDACPAAHQSGVVPLIVRGRSTRCSLNS